MAEFIGVFIPKDILSIKELNLTEKILLTQIIPLCVTEPCYASNQFFAERLGVTETTISTTLKSLDDKGYLQTILDRKNGNKRTIEIFYYKDTLFKIFKDPSLKSLNTLFKDIKDPLKNSYIGYLNNLKALFKNLNFIYKDESKDYSKEESKEDNKQDTEFSKNENSQPSQKEIELELKLEKANETIKALEEKEKKAPQAGGAVKKENPIQTLSIGDQCREFWKHNPNIYEPEMFIEFIAYWEEPDQKGKQRWQGEKYFDLKRRLSTWHNKSKSFNNQKNGSTSIVSAQKGGSRTDWNPNQVAQDAIALATAHLYQ